MEIANRVSDMKQKTSTIIIAIMALVIIALGMVSFFSIRREQRIERAYATIPLRDDMRGSYELHFPDTVSNVRFLDEERLLYLSGNTLIIQSIEDSLERTVLIGHSKRVNQWDVSPNGKTILSSSEDGTIRLWDARTGALLHTSEQLNTLSQPSAQTLMDVRFIKKGKKIISADREGIKTWGARNCRLLSSIDRNYFNGHHGLISPDGRTCCTQTEEGGFDLMDIKKGIYLYRQKSEGRPLCYSPDGRMLLVADDNGRMLGWDVPILQNKKGNVLEMIPFVGSDSSMKCAAFSPDGKEVVSVSQDGMIHVWNAETGTLRESFPSGIADVVGVCFDTKGTRILVYGKGSNCVEIWGPRVWVV